MKMSMTGQEKGDLLIEVTSWAGLTVLLIRLTNKCFYFTCKRSYNT